MRFVSIRDIRNNPAVLWKDSEMAVEKLRMFSLEKGFEYICPGIIERRDKF